MATFIPNDSGFGPDNTANLEATYVGYLGRAGDATGMAFWLDAINNGGLTLLQVQEFFVSPLQPEVLAIYPFLAAPTEAGVDPFITEIYNNLFNHDPDAAGLTYWHNYLAPDIGDSQVVASFIGFVINGAQGADATTIENKVTVAEFTTTTYAGCGILDFSATSTTQPEIQAYQLSVETIASTDDTQASVAIAEAQIDAFCNDLESTLTLTVGIDTPTQGFTTGTGGEFTQPGGVFNAPPGGNPPLGTTNTLNTGDILVSTVGDATLNYTAIHNFFGANDPFALGVEMNGVQFANILNLADDGESAGFSGNITGLTELTVLAGSNPFGDVQVGLTGQGLHTALETININAGDYDPCDIPGGDLNVWIESSAFTGGETVDVNLGGVGTFLDLDVTGGANFYTSANVSSLDSANKLHFDSNAGTIETLTVDGDQDLIIGGNVLNQDTLTTFDATAATGNVTSYFGGPNPGAVTALGGSGNNDFVFLTFNDATGTTTFTADDSVDGDGGDNKLTLQAFEGALLGAGVGPNIVNIDTIVHTTFEDAIFFCCNYGDVDNDSLTVDWANSGSAHTLELQADYNNHDVDVTHLTNTDTVVYSGFDLDNLTLEHVSPLGTLNLTFDQDPCVADFFGSPQASVIDDLFVDNVLLVNIELTGPATHNEINGADDINTNIEVSGDTDLQIGDKAEPYDFADGTVNASTFTADLTIYVGTNSQHIILGQGNDTIDVVSQAAGQDLYDLSVGGSDTVVFEATDVTDNLALTSANYTTITGYDIANDFVAIDVVSPNEIDLQSTNGADVVPTDEVSIYPLIFGVNDNLSGVDVNFIKMPSVSSIGFSFQATFDFYMASNGGTTIGVAAGADSDILMSMYDTNGGNMVLFTVDPDSSAPINTIDTGDDVDMISLVPMSLADYNTFGTNGSLAFVDFPS